MNILDENILKDQRQLLKSWRIAIQQIGHDAGWKGCWMMKSFPCCINRGILLSLHVIGVFMTGIYAIPDIALSI